MPSPETPADTIRRAAALIRQRAEAATPGPWAVSSQGAGARQDWYVTSPSHGLVSTGTHEDRNDFLAIERDHRDAEHIASWHPIVALAVAESWGHIADDIEANESYQIPVEGDLWVVRNYVYGRKDWTATLVAARAFLGEVPDVA